MIKQEEDKNSEAFRVQHKVVPRDIEKEMKQSFIEYAMSVIVDRAVPDVRDGLKPVHRRIIYTMFEEGYTPDKAYRKCATTVGVVMGKYHPHGDAAIYDALVRLAQDFSMRAVLVDGNGNFGSRDNDPPAAMRYTEARLTKIALEMVADINKNTVDFKPNFDEHEEEPVVLPSRFPNLLVNGSSGIAVGMATNIPPHNLGEVIDGVVALIDDPEISVDGLMQYIKGPDFPTAGNIMGKQGIREAYMTGKGRIIVRAKCDIEELPNGRQQIVISELPYMVNNAALVARIADLVKDKRVDSISGLRDEYSKAGIRIVIELKKDANANVLLNQLYKYTDLETAFCVNMLTCVPGEGGGYQPRIVNLKEALEYYIRHQESVVRRRTQFDLDKDLDRAHILEGTLIALDHIDEVIRIIRESRTEPDAKAGLMERFDFTERQAQYIVDMRLGRLTGIEKDKVLEEYKAKQEEIAYFRGLLEDEKKLMEVVKDEILAVKAQYADERRTRILPYEGEIDLEDLINEHDIAITLTHLGYIKRTSADTYKAQHRGGKGITGAGTREEDFVEQLMITSSHDTLLFITDKGRMYSLKGYEIPDAGRTAKGTAVVNLLRFTEGEKVASVIAIRSFEDAKYLIFGTRNGLIKKTALSAYANVRASGIIAIDLREGDKIVNVRLANDEDIMMVTHGGMSIRFEQEDVRETGRASMGVRGITLKENDYVIGMDLCKEGKTPLLISEFGYGKRGRIDDYRLQGRGGKGIITYKISEKTGSLVSMLMVDDDNDVMIITSNGTIIRVHVKDISIFGRATRGVTLMRATADNYIADCAATTFDEGEESAVPETDADAAQEDAGVEDAPEAEAVDNADADVTDEVTDAAEDRTEE
jgi:DNA gyrase subunit A